jgi:2-methylcitrate dehydratase PrpD
MDKAATRRRREVSADRLGDISRDRVIGVAAVNEDLAGRSPVTDAVLAHALRMREDQLPERAASVARDFVIDAIGVGIAGSTTAESRMLLETAITWGISQDARVWGSGVRLPAVHAALVNAHQSHCLEFDAIHEPSVVHPMSVVFPVLAAWVQRAAAQGRTTNGRDFLKALAVGVDVAAGLGDVVTSPLQFFRPATAGGLGAVAALTVAAEADPQVAVGAFGVVYGGISGTMQPHEEGAQVLALQVGFNARAALSGWDLAEAGFRGPRRVLEGRFGYYRLFEASGEPELLGARLGNQWEIERTSVKPFPSGRATHGVLDAVLTMQEEHGFGFADVAAVEAFVPPMVMGLVGRPVADDLSPGVARLCLRYLVAFALREHRVQLDAYDESALRDASLLELAGRVSVIPDDNPDPNAFDPQRVIVRLRSGQAHELVLERSLGSPPRPLRPEQLEAKFRSNLDAAGRGDDGDRLLELAHGIGDLDDVSILIEAM